MNLRRHYVDTPFGQAHVRLAEPADDAGRLPLFCLPPQPLSGRALEPLLAVLGQRRRVAAVDLPGFGLSDAPRTGATLEHHLGWLLGLADALGMPACAWLGWLTGGRFAVPLAARHPARVTKLVLLGAPVPTAEQRATLKPPPVAAPRRDGSHLQAEWSKWIAWWPEGVPLEEPSDNFADTILGLGREDRGRILEVTRHVHYDEWLPQVEAPVLVINPVGPMHESTARAAPLLRNGRVVDVPVAMFPLLSTPHVSCAAQLIDAFLD